jgi:nitric oxide reductase large subunit
LFAVGCLNSFTNFAHHTYHVPQTHTVKWISFIVSMMEIIIVFRVMSDILKMRGVKTADGAYTATGGFLTSAKWWTAAMVLGGVVISVPSWNSIIHGTHVVVGHAMGAELGIDSMVLFGVVTFLLLSLYPDAPAVRQRIDSSAMRSRIAVLNAAAAILVAWLMLSGTYTGILRYYQRPMPGWLGYGPFVFVVCGFFVFVSLGRLLDVWGPLLVRHRNERNDA